MFYVDRSVTDTNLIDAYNNAWISSSAKLVMTDVNFEYFGM